MTCAPCQPCKPALGPHLTSSSSFLQAGKQKSYFSPSPPAPAPWTAGARWQRAKAFLPVSAAGVPRPRGCRRRRSDFPSRSRALCTGCSGNPRGSAAGSRRCLNKQHPLVSVKIRNAECRVKGERCVQTRCLPCHAARPLLRSTAAFVHPPHHFFFFSVSFDGC